MPNMTFFVYGINDFSLYTSSRCPPFVSVRFSFRKWSRAARSDAVGTGDVVVVPRETIAKIVFGERERTDRKNGPSACGGVSRTRPNNERCRPITLANRREFDTRKWNGPRGCARTTTACVLIRMSSYVRVYTTGVYIRIGH